METTNIYILIDPITNMVRYVGKANNVTQRYRAHLNRARKHQVHKKNWIEKLKKEGLRPIIEVIDVVPINEWIFWETYWISQFKTWGFDLINYTNGGDGCTFGNQTSFKKGDGGKKVVGYDSNYIKIYEFSCCEDATKYLKTHRSSIPKCASGKSKTIKNIAWFYKDEISKLTKKELKLNIDNKFKKNIKQNSGSFFKGQKGLQSKKIQVLNLETGVKEIFDSGSDFAKLIGVSQSSISWAIKNDKIVKNNFKIKLYG